MMNASMNRHILLIDDLPSIHEDFRKILSNETADPDLDAQETALFGSAVSSSFIGFELDSAFQGREGLAKVSESLSAGQPYAMAFVDMRMPPGWDGLETIEHLWQADPRLQVVICTAYSDYAWEEVFSRLDACDRLLILKKPFDSVEVYQLANMLTEKWRLTRQAERQVSKLEEEVQKRTIELKLANDALLEHFTAMKSAEQALRIKNQAIESSVNAIFLTNNDLPDNPIEYINPAFEKMTGYTRSETLGKNINFLLGEEHSQPNIEIIQKGMQQGEKGQVVLRNFRKDGSLFWSEYHIAPVHDEAGHLSHFVGILNDITEFKELEGLLEQRANYDVLTNLPNRALLMDRITQALAIASRQQAQMAIAFIDLDHFKFINDHLGHDAGDILLKEVATRLRGCTREADTVARLGGDEFIVLLHPDLNGGNPLPMIRRIVERVAQPVHLKGEEHAVSCSIGVSVYPRDGENAAILLKNADIAMYHAKTSGRNSFQFFKPEMVNEAAERLQLENDLRRALASQEFELYYQPKVETLTGQIVGCEALIRWHHPTKGLILPAKFIPIAEQSDLILHIGEWTLRQACLQSRAWIDDGLPTLQVAVNISARQFDRQDIVGLAKQALLETGIKPATLEVEITETLSMQEPQKTIHFIQQLKAIGVGVAIDDFGTGYSNLSYLKKFPVDTLKLDLQFINDLASNPEDCAILNAIIEIGHSLHLNVVAEGVEQEEQLSILKAHGCDQIQGKLFGPALQAEDFAKLVRAERHLLAN